MNKKHKETIIVSFLGEKEKYKKFAEYILRFIKEDPLLPKESIHTIIYRIKDEFRLIEKIENLNNINGSDLLPITDHNYKELIEDLLGVRIICLRLSDVENVEDYLNILSDEKIFKFLKLPEHKKSFILPANPGNSISSDVELRSTGYSSIHYQIKLGENSDAPAAFKNLHFELQLRTILEEAWSEIDHKYRYVHSRVGKKIPVHVDQGFYNFSAYLQVAALQAEYLCRLAEADNPRKDTKIKEIDQNGSGDEAYSKLSSSQIEEELKKNMGIKISQKTMIYIKKRLREINSEGSPYISLWSLLCNDRLNEFKFIFKEMFKTDPFESDKNKNIDLINALNFSIFWELHGKRVAQEGLKTVLKWRIERAIGNNICGQ